MDQSLGSGFGSQCPLGISSLTPNTARNDLGFGVFPALEKSRRDAAVSEPAELDVVYGMRFKPEL
jgi:hypothetical protein